MPKSANDHVRKPSKANDAELTQQYRQIGSAAILGALAAKMKQQATKDEAERPARTRRAA